MVSVIPCPDYRSGTVLDAMRGRVPLDWVKPGMRIGIKVNLVAALKPETAAVTDPVCVSALCTLLKERGASVVVGDSPGGLFTPAALKLVYQVSGMDRVTDTGAELNTDTSVKTGRLTEACRSRSFEYTGWLDGCDALIDFAKLKTHGMLGLSGAVKNMFGTVPGTRKPEMHYQFPKAEEFADMLIDLNLHFRPHLYLVDAVECMQGNGPTMGKPVHVGCILSGENGFETDEVCAALLGADPEQLPTVVRARVRGLSDGYVLNGDLKPFLGKVTDLPPMRDLRFLGGRLFGPVVQRLMEAKPTADLSKCVGCGKCASLCPAKAIEIRKGKVSFDRKKCIRCFCCQEFCPKGALRSARTLIARILTK